MARIHCEHCGKKIKVVFNHRDDQVQNVRQGWNWKTVALCLLSVTIGVVASGVVLLHRPKPHTVPAPQQQETTLGDLLDATPEDLAKYDLAVVNLACAAGLPGTENLDVKDCLNTLDVWAAQVKAATAQRHFVYDSEPAKFDNSENWWKVAFLVRYLNGVIGTKYNPRLKALPPTVNKFDTTSFADSRDVFLHGLVNGRKEGTCSSMPVLVVCVGRRMGYPLKLAKTRRHLFVKWDDVRTGERFNIEVTHEYPAKKPDSFYMTWPDKLTDAEVQRNGYLSPFTPAQELATFLGFRGLCLWNAHRLAEAQMAFAAAHRCEPRDPGISQFVMQVLNEEWSQGGHNGFAGAALPQVADGTVPSALGP